MSGVFEAIKAGSALLGRSWGAIAGFGGLRQTATALALTATLLGAPAGANASDVDVEPPNLGSCPVAGNPGNAPLHLPVTPGNWWDTERHGTGWRLLEDQDQGGLSVVWFTFDRSGRPIWLFSGWASIEQNGQSWRAPLYMSAWDHEASALADTTRVGSVAISFHPGQRDRAALRWQWDEAGPETHEECIRNFTGTDPSEAAGAGSGFAGGWLEGNRADWGAYVTVMADPQAPTEKHIELTGLAVYDDAGQPVWTMARTPARAGVPAIGVRETHSLDYLRAGPGYPEGVPTQPCTYAQGSCIARWQDAGDWTRQYASTEHLAGRVQMSANTGKLPTGAPTITQFQRPADDGFVNLYKAARPARIIADQRSCRAASENAACQVTIDWAVDPKRYPNATVFRYDLDSGHGKPVVSAQRGRRAELIEPSERIRFELRKNNDIDSELLSETYEVQGYTVASAYDVDLSTTNKLVKSIVDDPEDASATFRLAAAGKIRFQTREGGPFDEQQPFDEWMDPESLTESTNYEVKASRYGGVTPGGVMDTWIPMTGPVDWWVKRTSPGTTESRITVQIRRIGNQTPETSRVVTLRATVNPVPTVKFTQTNKVVQSVVSAPDTASALFRLATSGKIRFQLEPNGLYLEQQPYDEWLEPESATESYNYEVRAVNRPGNPGDSLV